MGSPWKSPVCWMPPGLQALRCAHVGTSALLLGHTSELNLLQMLVTLVGVQLWVCRHAYSFLAELASRMYESISFSLGQQCAAPTIQNGVVNEDSFLFGATVTFSCNAE